MMEAFEYSSTFTLPDGTLTPEAALWLLALLDYIAALEARIEALESP